MYGISGYNSNFIDQLLRETGVEKALGGSSNINNLKGSIFDVAALTQTNNYEEKGVIVNDLVQKALSFLGNILGGNGESKKADEEVNKQTKKVEKLKSKSADLGVELEGSFKSVAKDIEDNKEIIDDAQKLLKKTQEELKEKQEKINAIIVEITKAQEKLAKETDPTKQKELLEEISGYAIEMASLGSSIKEYNEQVQGLNDAVTKSADNVEDATEKMQVVEQNGKARIQELASETTQSTQDVVQTGQKGTANKVEAQVLAAQAKAAESNVITSATLAPKLEMASFDKDSAAQKRLQSLQANLSRIAQGIGNLNNADKIANQFSTSIGSSIEEYITAFGGWETTVNPVLEGLGTLAAGFSDGGDLSQLTKAVDSDLAKINSNEVEPAEEKPVEEKPEADESVSNPAGAESTETTPVSVSATPNEEKVNNLETPNVKLTNLLKKEAKK